MNITKDIAKSKYLQLLIPKKNVHNFYPEGDNSSFSKPTTPLSEMSEDKDTIVEMRLEVYYVREFQADNSSNKDLLNATH